MKPTTIPLPKWKGEGENGTRMIQKYMIEGSTSSLFFALVFLQKVNLLAISFDN